MSDILLKVNNLNLNYGAIQALKDISFEVRQGEVVSLIGSNGAGKTSTLRAISGIKPSQGSIHFKNLEISKLPAHERVFLGIAQSPEGRGVFTDMTVFENLELGAYCRKDHAKIKEDLEFYLDLFPILRTRMEQAAGTLSGGEQQMLAICRALMSRPQLLLLDEPSLGLAPLIISKIFEIIKKVNEQGISVLLVEQNARMALKVSHRAYVLECGKITLQDSAKNLLSNDEIQKSYLGGA